MNNYPKIPFAEIATLIRGVSYDKSVALLAAKDGFIPILRANNIQKNLVLNDLVYVPNDFVKEEQMIRKGDIILAMSSGSKDLVGKSAQANNDINAAFGTFCGLIRAKDNIDSKFLGLYFQTQEYRNFVSYQSQGVNICNLKKKDIESQQIPLPPLPTQQAIVTRIETLFAELDKAVQHLRTAQQQLKTYRQAVLNHWLNNDEGKWEMVKLKDCTKKIFAGGDVPKNNFSEIKTEKYRIPIYANAVKQKGLYGYTNVSRVNEPCVTIAGRGSGTGHTEIREEPFFPIVRLIVIIPSDNLNNSFLKYMVDSKTMAITGSAIPQLTVPTVEEYEFSLPPLAEQQRIVAEIESRLSQATASETYIENALQQAEALRQSILKKAFSGELVVSTSSTTDEAVPELVEGTVAEAMKGTTVASTGSATKLRNKDL